MKDMKIGEDFTFYIESLFNGAKLILINEAYYIYSMPSSPSGRSPHSRSIQDVGKLPGVGDLMSENMQIASTRPLSAPWMIFGRLSPSFTNLTSLGPIDGRANTLNISPILPPGLS